VFFFLVGSIITLFYFSSFSSNSGSYNPLCIGVLLMIMGFTLWFRGRDRTPVARFRLLRKFASKKKEEIDEE